MPIERKRKLGLYLFLLALGVADFAALLAFSQDEGAGAAVGGETAPVSLNEVHPSRVIETANPQSMAPFAPEGSGPGIVPIKPTPPPKPAPPKPRHPPKIKMPVSWEETERLIGRRGTFGGIVVATFKTKRYILLHFHKDHPDYFTVMIPRSELWKFPKNPQEYYMDKDVLVEGLVVRRDGRPVIFVRDRAKIWVVGEALHGKIPKK